MRKLDIWVLSCPEYAHLLPEFVSRFNKYWGDDLYIYVSKEPMETWSNGVLRLINKIKSRYFILLHEDFFIDKEVDHKALAELTYYISKKKVSRFSLVGNHDPDRTVPHHNYFLHKTTAPYMLSFEASIFNKDFLNEYMGWDEDAWAVEREGIKRTFGKQDFVLYTKDPVISYQDKMRRGVEQNI